MNEVWLTVRVSNRRELTVLLDDTLIVGRDCDGLVVADSRVSRRHTSFEPIGDRVRVIDLSSSNGTMVNGDRITEPTLVDANDHVTIGDTQIVVRSSSGSTAATPIQTEIVAARDDRMKTSIDLVVDSIDVSTLSPQIVGVEDEAGTLTVVFSDIEASTELALSMGDMAWVDVLRTHHELVEAHVGAHRGRIVKNQGDGYMLCFRSARQALLACIGMQRDLERLATSPSEPTVRVRMGAHTGEVVMQEDGDLFGKHVIVAARVGALADGGQILVSSLVKQIAEPRGDLSFGNGFEAQLKGIEGTMTIFEVDWSAFH